MLVNRFFLECEADGNISTTSVRCRSGEFVTEAQTVCPSCPQTLGSDTVIQSDTCMVFCAEGYQAVKAHTNLDVRVQQL